MFHWTRWLRSLSGKNRRPVPLRNSLRVRPIAQRLESRETPATFSGGAHVAYGPMGLVTGAAEGGGPHVCVYNPTTGSLQTSFMAFDTKFSGGVFVAASSDNKIIAGAGEGGVPLVRIFDANGNAQGSFLAFDKSFSGGVRVASGDYNADGFQDIIAAQGPGGSPIIRVFSGKDFLLLKEIQAFNPAFSGGVNVAAADFNGDNKVEIVAAADEGGVPLVRVFDGATGNATQSFYAFPKAFSGGVSVAASSLNGGRIVVGALVGGVPVVQVFNTSGVAQKAFFTFDEKFSGGVWVCAGDFNNDGTLDYGAGSGPGGTSAVNTNNGATLKKFTEFNAFDSTVTPTPDTSAPVITILTPAPNQTFFASPLITGGAADNVGIVKLEVQQDGGAFTQIPFGANGSFSYTPTVNAVGAHAIRFRATDAAGNQSSGGVLNYTLAADTQAPEVTITSPPSGQTFSTNPLITGTATDNGRVNRVEASVDAASFVQVSFNSATNVWTFTPSLKTDGTQDGQHSVQVRAIDESNNVSSVATFTFTLSTQFPLSVSLAAASDTGIPNNNITELPTVSLIGVTKPNATVTVVGTNVTTTANGSGNYTLTGVPLVIGPNPLTVRATDSANATRDTAISITRNLAPSVAGAPANFSIPSNSQATILNLPQIFSDADVNSMVTLNTGNGNFDVELFDQQTPQTVSNFLKYIDDGRYTNAIFHRTVPNFVIQGGGFSYSSNPSTINNIPTFPPVQNEPGVSNQAGTIAMAKLGGDPNSATSQFFFNLVDNSRGGPALDSQNGGFTAFGAVRGGGQTVVNSLAAIPTQDRSSSNGVFTELPLQNYPAPPAGNFPTDTTPANFALINSIQVKNRTTGANADSLTFSIVSNSAPQVVNAVISGAKLTLNYTPGASGTATIVLRAVDRNGATVDTSFTVTVTNPT